MGVDLLETRRKYTNYMCFEGIVNRVLSFNYFATNYTNAAQIWTRFDFTNSYYRIKKFTIYFKKLFKWFVYSWLLFLNECPALFSPDRNEKPTALGFNFCWCIKATKRSSWGAL